MNEYKQSEVQIVSENEEIKFDADKLPVIAHINFDVRKSGTYVVDVYADGSYMVWSK